MLTTAIRLIAALLSALLMWSAFHGPLDSAALAYVMWAGEVLAAVMLGFGAITGRGISTWRQNSADEHQ